MGMEFGIEKYTMLKRKTKNKGRNRTVKSRKNSNMLRKGKLQIFGNTENGHYHIKWYVRKKGMCTLDEQKTAWNLALR